jgi:hypothetical protein
MDSEIGASGLRDRLAKGLQEIEEPTSTATWTTACRTT